MSLQQFLEQEKNKKEEKYKYEYNPSWGMQPYWAGGEDMLSTFKEDPSKNITTTKAPMVCGEECNYILQKIKHVCAHKTDYNAVNGCTGEECSGKPGENIDVGFKTFNTYCEYLDAACQNDFTEGRT
ncbi:uncharacterized protein LOC113493580 [Trichoplusia ni]|uniref:Uncharacterized protein LOC113493580 n=1 Tax=Trichoplusia ni TaxID=7111 RepID=A0A7E5VGT3_TRINI|nr:uncharacterized protein LOC113493580 [Trichoplusia ni]